MSTLRSRGVQPTASQDSPAAGYSQLSISELSDRSKRISSVYRAICIVLLSATLVLYLVPLPSYFAGTHSQMHYTMFHGKHSGTLDDLIYLPVLPFYLFFLSIQGTLIVALLWEVADAAGVPFVVKRRKVYAYPAQPHPFGTAPDFLIHTLATIKWSPGKPGPDGVRPPGVPVMTTVEPRFMYVFLLWILMLPLPLMVFGGGSYDNAIWWLISAVVGFITVVAEKSISNAQRALRDLAAR